MGVLRAQFCDGFGAPGGRFNSRNRCSSAGVVSSPHFAQSHLLPTNWATMQPQCTQSFVPIFIDEFYAVTIRNTSLPRPKRRRCDNTSGE